MPGFWPACPSGRRSLNSGEAGVTLSETTYDRGFVRGADDGRGESDALRRWRLLDAILLIAATAVAMLPAKDRWTEVVPVARQLEATRLFDRRILERAVSPANRARADGFGSSQFEQIVGPATGAGEIHRDWDNAADCDI